MLVRLLTPGPLGPLALTPPEHPSSSSFSYSEENKGEESMLERLLTPGPLTHPEPPSSSSFWLAGPYRSLETIDRESGPPPPPQLFPSSRKSFKYLSHFQEIALGSYQKLPFCSQGGPPTQFYVSHIHKGERPATFLDNLLLNGY
jgi:hypothetical protein